MKNLLVSLAFTMTLPAMGNKLDPKDEALVQTHKRYGTPALAAGMLTAKGKEWYGAVGLRKYDNTIPVTGSDKWHLGSNGKSMTAVVIAKLVEEGKLKWESKLSEFYPELSESMTEEFRSVTVAQLTSHRSGLTASLVKFDEGKLWKTIRDSKLDPVEGRKTVAWTMLTKKASSKPGTKFEYSNVNYIIVGNIIDRVTKGSFERALVEKVFAPLKMNSCGFGAPGTADIAFPDQPWGHKFLGKFLAMPPSFDADNPPTLSPAGTIHCSLKDWMTYLKVHLKGHAGKNTPVLKAAGFKKLHTAAMNQEYTYGGWIRNDLKGGFALAHEGDNTFSHSIVMLLPKKGVAAISATNMGGDVGSGATFEMVEKLLSQSK